MVQKPLNPDVFNIDLLIPSKGLFQKLGLGEVVNVNALVSSTNEFEPKGLYSTEIFGQVGSGERMRKLGYIDLRLPILHPLIFKLIYNDVGKSLRGIIDGKTYAIFDKSSKTFIPVDPYENPNADTGFTFFLEHIEELEFKETDSAKQKAKRELIKKYGTKDALFTEYLVIPAGLRDYTVDAKGSPSIDEINDIYSKIIGLSNTLRNVNYRDTAMLKFQDTKRLQMQKHVLAVYMYIKSLIDGKNKFIQRKWASRACDYATSNVITATPVTQHSLSQDPNTVIGLNSTVVGIYQYLKALGPIAYNKVESKIVSNFLTPDAVNFRVIDPKTLTLKEIPVSSKIKNDWGTYNGVNNIINKLGQDVIKNSYVLLDGNYPALILDRGDKIDVIFDPTELPPEYNFNVKENVTKFKEAVNKHDITYPVRPITYVELFMLAVHDCVPMYPALASRYPIINAGSIYPTMPFLKTTVKGRKVEYNIGNSDRGICYEYPIMGLDYLRSLAVHSTHLAKLDGDHDGDVLSFILLLTDESRRETTAILNSKEFYLDALGNFDYSVSTNVLNIVIGHLSE